MASIAMENLAVIEAMKMEHSIKAAEDGTVSELLISINDQVESLGAQFLTVNLDEDGSSTDGYAKVMSKDFIDAEMPLFTEQCKDIDIIMLMVILQVLEIILLSQLGSI